MGSTNRNDAKRTQRSGCNKKKRRRHKEGTKEESALRSGRTVRGDANAEDEKDAMSGLEEVSEDKQRQRRSRR